MKVIRLEAENVKKLTAVDITPASHVVEITGKNGAGKTSVLDSLWWALAGTSEIQAQPIRKGEEKARIRLDLGDLVVIRRFNAQEDGTFTTTVTVENAEGARYPGPQQMLDALVGELTFDPLDFTRKSAREQFETLKRLTGVDFAEIETKRREAFDQRTEANRKVRDLKAMQASLGGMPDDAPTERVDEQALVEKMARAAEHNGDVQRRENAREAAKQKIEELTTGIAELETRITALQAERAALRKRLDDAPDLPPLIDTNALSNEITRARGINILVEQGERRAKVAADLLQAEAEAGDLTARIDQLDQDKRDAISQAKMPVEGLGLGEDAVMLSGMPFDQASDAEQLRASVAIAAAANPKLRIIRVRDGSLLDQESMGLLAAFAAEHDMQVWIETVQSGRPGAILIEDGRVAEKPKEPDKPTRRSAKDKPPKAADQPGLGFEGPAPGDDELGA